jgi:hypothetical protein
MKSADKALQLLVNQPRKPLNRDSFGDSRVRGTGMGRNPMGAASTHLLIEREYSRKSLL